MITIVDYGMGNLRSVQKAFNFLGCDAILTSSKNEIEQSNGVVLPGVGAFDDAVHELKKRELTEVVSRSVILGKPFLGICLGMHLLFESSDEGKQNGLSVFKGKVKRLPEIAKIPHMGWNTLNILHPKNLFLEGATQNSWYYFVHSYYVEPIDVMLSSSTTDYGIEFVSSVSKGNLFACQFHPEKSGNEGLRIIKNFAKLCGELK